MAAAALTISFVRPWYEPEGREFESPGSRRIEIVRRITLRHWPSGQSTEESFNLLCGGGVYCFQPFALNRVVGRQFKVNTGLTV
jgi:hypothetical protein